MNKVELNVMELLEYLEEILENAPKVPITGKAMIDTKEFGIIHTSSSVFEDGFDDYRGECDCMRIVGVKAKLGTCYKCVPVITAESEFTEDSDEPLPFE